MYKHNVPYIIPWVHYCARIFCAYVSLLRTGRILLLYYYPYRCLNVPLLILFDGLLAETLRTDRIG